MGNTFSRFSLEITSNQNQFEVKSFEDNHRRDSFSHRVCDDLSEVILQFLPFKDKLSLECVSKQFQRTIFERQFELILDSKLENAIINKKVDLKTLLQKLPNIKSLNSSSFVSKPSVLEDHDINEFVENLNNLVEIECDFEKMSEQMRDKFGKKFGPKVTTFTAKPEDIPMIAKHFPNIKTLNRRSFFEPFRMYFPFSECNSVHISGLVLNKLKKVCINFDEREFEVNSGQIFKSFKQLIQRHKNLIQLGIDLFAENDKTLKFIFNEISNLNDLIELNLWFKTWITDKDLAKGLKQISKSCPKLKYLSLKRISIEETSEDILFAKELKKFNQLKRLEIVINSFPPKTEAFDGFKCFNDSFKGFQNLTHLWIYFPTELRISDTLLANIDQILPKLQDLVLFAELEATEETGLALSRLQNLKAVLTYLPKDVDQSILLSIYSNIKNNCKRITSLRVWRVPQSLPGNRRRPRLRWCSLM